MMKHAMLVLAACGSSPPAPATASAVSSEPRVDMTCVERAREGKLLDDLPTELSGFHVTVAKDGVHLHRGGRALSDPEADALWGQVTANLFRPGGLAWGHSGYSSVFRCNDAPRNNCIKLGAWICQVDLPTLAARLAIAADHAGAAGAMLTADVTFEEARGPACRDGAACTPAAHYSRKATYDPARPRHAEPDHSGGWCHDDGDCEGKDSNECLAWYLRGGVEDAIGIDRTTPAFCGCVERRCRWFTQ